MKLLELKLKSKLAFFNVISKALIVTLLLITVPWLVREITRQNTDKDLLQKLDIVMEMIDSVGIDNFIDQDTEFKSFGSYDILKEEFISIEHIEKDTLIDVIEYSQRNIDEQIIDYRVLSYSVKYGEQTYLIEIGKSMDDIYSFEQNLKHYAFLFLMIILLVTFIVDLSFIQYLLKPLDKIVDKLRKTKHPDEYDYKTVQTKTSDFVYLDITINNLMQKIEKAFTSEREYISNVSHELLTPISIIRIKLDNLMLSGTLSESDMIKIIESKKTLQRLTHLIRTLLIMSRLENEEYILNDNVKINQLVDDVINEIHDKITTKELTLEIDTFKTNHQIRGNKDLLFTMLYNIINNSIKYTEKGSIKIHSEITKDSFMLVISDSGVGISQNKLEQIFSRFKSFGENADSFGLGLALTKKIADYHKIEFKINSQIGVGTNFILIFKMG
jgi:signal transduction histidine kinase